MERVNRRERLTLAVLLGGSLYLVKFLGFPTAFSYTDEFIHLRSTQDILQTHHLFADNPLLPTAPDYPGLAATTAGLVGLTGLSPFVAGVLIIGVARLLVSACFFIVVEKVTGSDRAAAAASLIYFANPMFLFWSSAFAYENLALPLAAFIVWWVGRTRREVGLAAQVITVLAIAAVTVTHHVAGFALAALLCAWWVAEKFTRPPTSARRRLGIVGLLAVVATLTWLAFPARQTADYLFGQNIFPGLKQTASLVFGGIAPRQLYSSGGYASPIWETILGFAAIAVLLIALPFALRLTWARRHYAPMAVAGLVAAAYPLSLIPRLAPNGVAISGRSSEYVFAGLACVVGLLAAVATGPDPVARRVRADKQSIARRADLLLMTALITIVFIGHVTIGTAFYQRLPESKQPSGYPWSVQPDVVNAAEWSRSHLGAHQPFAANTVDANALATYGREDPAPKELVWPIFFATEMDATVVQSIRTTGVRYLLVNWRMTRGVPPTPGYYFSPWEPGAGEYRSRFPAAGLLKFASAPCTRRVYESGEVAIFDVTSIADGSCPALSAFLPPTDEGGPQ